jgi:alkylation response protein AidB-like acyl-CoA dehydrogenase
LELLFSAKAEVAECAVTAVNEALMICGGGAYRAGGLLERSLRDVQAAHLMSPTTELLRTWTGRALLGLPILGE